jgi:hypothetical protein
MARIIVQYFGDGVETDFDFPLDGITSGFIPYVTVDGVAVDFTYTAQVDDTPASVTISAPASRAIINLCETNAILAGFKTVQATSLVDEVDGAPTVAGAVDARVTGNSAAYPKSTNGAQTLLAADADGDRQVIIVVTVTEVFADGDGGQPTFIIGQTGTTNKFLAVTALDDASLGDTFMLQGTLTDNTALLVTAVAATGSTSTGAISVGVIAVPKAA